MTINWAQDWPVYVLLALVVWFFLYVIISGNRKEKTGEKNQNKEKSK